MPGSTQRTLTREQVRSVDRIAIDEFGVPGVVLMENAGRNTAELLLELGVNGPVVVCCGKGNNGGDGFVIARHLDNRGIDVEVLLFCEPNRLTGDAAINHRVVEASGIPLSVVDDPSTCGERFTDADWIVDALLGTGTTGGVREPFATAIDRINAAGARVLAVDLPSGLDCDAGVPLGCCVRAYATATFVARKVGFDNPAAAEYLGEVRVLDIGAPRAVLSRVGQ